MKITVKNSVPVWPQQCAACGDEPTSTATAKCIVGKGVIPLPGFLLVRSNVLELQYPVCNRHKLSAAIFGRLSQRNLFNLGLGVVAVIFALAFVVGLYRHIAGLPERETMMSPASAGLLAAAYWIVFYLAKKHTPVKVADFKGDSVRLEFSNEQYAAEFKNSNSLPR
jgi:hypothetical protein